MTDSTATLSSEFYWNSIFIKVEDKLFCVPQCEFLNSSHVFADMFLLPSGPMCSEGQDRDHPIVLEGYKKDEFACLLKVMYPTAGSLISGTNLELRLKKEEWVSVLKLSTIWDMQKIRQYAIHRLSIDVTLSPIEKVLLARAHRVSVWLDEAIPILANRDYKPALDDLVTLGWETAARILWIRDNLDSLDYSSDTLHFTMDAIKCPSCSSSSNLITAGFDCYYCGCPSYEHDILTYRGLGLPISGTPDRLVSFREIVCQSSGKTAFDSTQLSCNLCSFTCNDDDEDINVRVRPLKGLKQGLKQMIEEMFGEEIKLLRPVA